MKSLKTPSLSWGKSRALTKIGPHIPDLTGYNEYREPFLGGASVAIQVFKMYPDLSIWVKGSLHTSFIFWQLPQENGKEMCNFLSTIQKIS